MQEQNAIKFSNGGAKIPSAKHSNGSGPSEVSDPGYTISVVLRDSPFQAACGRLRVKEYAGQRAPDLARRYRVRSMFRMWFDDFFFITEPAASVDCTP